jgi:hypothetical protein
MYTHAHKDERKKEKQETDKHWNIIENNNTYLFQYVLLSEHFLIL